MNLSNNTEAIPQARAMQIMKTEKLTNWMFMTPYSKMAATQDGLGRVARKRGIEGHGTQHSQWRPFETILCLVHRF